MRDVGPSKLSKLIAIAINQIRSTDDVAQFFSFIHSNPFNLIWNKIQIIVTIWTEQGERAMRYTYTQPITIPFEWTDVVNDKWNEMIFIVGLDSESIRHFFLFSFFRL